MNEKTTTELFMSKERGVSMAALAFVIISAWIYTLAGPALPAPESGMSGMAMPMDWGPGHAFFVFVMWWVMMVAMMLPSAAPMVLLFSALKRSRGESEALPYQSPAFVAGYLAVWGAFSLAAVGVQWQLERLDILSPDMRLMSTPAAAGLLVAAGLYQLTPIKRACLSQCRSPAALLARYWRPGALGAFRMGVQHGRFCLGCCWFLMLLLFVGGIMNVWWIAGLALYVAVEKLGPAGGRLSLITGAALAASGVLLAVIELA